MARFLTDKQAFKARWLYANTPLTVEQVGERFGLTKTAMRGVIKGLVYKDVAYPKHRKQKPRAKAQCYPVTPQARRWIQTAPDNVSNARIAKILNLHLSTVQRIRSQHHANA